MIQKDGTKEVSLPNGTEKLPGAFVNLASKQRNPSTGLPVENPDCCLDPAKLARFQRREI
jgi:hypothetical protein